jgi:hypothetical protein
MEVLISADEWYPVYSIGDGFGIKCQLTPEEIQICRKAAEDFNKAQDILHKAYQKSWEYVS